MAPNGPRLASIAGTHTLVSRERYATLLTVEAENARLRAVLQAIHARGPVTCESSDLDCGHAGCRAMAETWADVDAALRGDGQ